MLESFVQYQEQGAYVLQQALLLAPLIGAIGLSFRQRQAIRERDNGCIDPDPSIKHGGKIEIHHEVPKEFAENALGWSPDEYNDPANLGSNCRNHHRGHPNSKHPNMHKAVYEETQEGKRGAIRAEVDAMKEKAKNGVVYWNIKPGFDAQEKATIKEHNKKMDEKHGGRKGWWPFATKEEVEEEEEQMNTKRKRG